ncbi:hypothetical protein [Dactylosporangium matsuzakiense]|uniref:Uncharacterized protein n=1 Tax=Dactylosporangium matsuzakiense TaxID=53360 RepID=A0A9W6NQB5_9ACTN|nr:hypothetical protein [Dactylosporangium matsuzakiense]UWZ42002.1 hypothetical protein Dmats_30865 [Dactylosporangium matsuzakiense]GLL04917.1 hypothetical protein GCM10017581_066640 [Dactylosporangium matsuzakiense]
MHTGRPVAAPTAPAVSDTGLQERLWAASERLTGVTYALPGGAVSPG